MTNKRLCANLDRLHKVLNVNMNQWRVAITKIEERTGLDFGAKMRGRIP